MYLRRASGPVAGLGYRSAKWGGKQPLSANSSSRSCDGDAGSGTPSSHALLPSHIPLSSCSFSPSSSSLFLSGHSAEPDHASAGFRRAMQSTAHAAMFGGGSAMGVRIASPSGRGASTPFWAASFKGSRRMFSTTATTQSDFFNEAEVTTTVRKCFRRGRSTGFDGADVFFSSLVACRPVFVLPL